MLKSFLLNCCTLSLLLSPFALHGASAERMKSDLDSIVNTIKNQYSMTEWKQEYLDWSLEDEVANAKERIDSFEHITQKDFQIILKDFFASFRDYHVRVLFYSTECASLPFHVKQSQGRYFITYVNYDKIPYNTLAVGDEIFAFDGVPIQEVVEQLMPSTIRESYNPTDLSMATLALTYRTGERGFVVPKGLATIAFTSPYDEKIKEVELIWDYTPEMVTNWFHNAEEAEVKKSKLNTFLDSKKMVSGDIKADLDRLEKEKESKDLLASRQTFLPRLGEVWWETDPDDLFDAYIYENEEGDRIGYLRIPSYLGSDQHFIELAKIIFKFQEKTDALVIDQINNPGGNIFYCYAIASLLTDRLLTTPQHHQAITQQDVSQAIINIVELENIENNFDAQQVMGMMSTGLQVDYQFSKKILNWSHFIMNEWSQGKTFTSPYSLFGVDKIAPSPCVNYNKPILILINELDISCGDFFPAIMQDNERATLLGTKTSGAGGYVLTTEFPNISGIESYNYTASKGVRPDGDLLENLGVSPDIEYEISPEDLQFGFGSYAELINQVVIELIENNEYN